MAGITYVGTDWSTTAGNKTVAVTPAVGDLLFIIASNSGRTTAQPPTFASTSGNILTFSQHATAFTKNTSADSGWIFIADSFCYAASSTNVNMAQSGDSGGGFVLWRVSGMVRAGQGAIRQVGKQDNQAAGTPSITMGVACLTGNPCFGYVGTGTNGSANSAAPTSWTEHVDTGYNVPANGREAVSRASGNTLTTIAWTAATPSAFGSILAELDASVITPPSPQPRITRVYSQILAH